MLINFVCNNCDCKNSITKMFKNFKDIPPFLDCGQCGIGKLERQLGAPSAKSTQVVDNGNQAKAVEVMNEVVLKEQERLYREDD
jgi:hypothetical protein